MSELKYYTLRREEWLDFVTISFVLALLFALLFARFENSDLFFEVLFRFFIFLIVLLGLRMVLMKWIGVGHGYEVLMRQTYFDRYWFRAYDKLSHVKHSVDKTVGTGLSDLGSRMKGESRSVSYHHDSHDGKEGVPMTVISVFLYLFTLGYIVFPSLWRYQYRRIEHLAFGKFHEYDVRYDWIATKDITGYRYSQIIFGGFAFYFIFLLMMKYVFAMESSPFYYWYFFIVFWIAVVTLIPIPGTEGFDLWYTSKFAWISAMTLVTLGMIAIFVFNEIWYSILITIICILMIIYVYYWRKFMKSDK